ncbi:flagellar hook protein FlgE, partial [Campylobacter coli]|nr:flagellar hook protein FlgE [Campylobacter coli]
AEGFFEQYNISDDGSIVAQFSNGKNAIVGKLALYNFINEQGLVAMGDNIFAATANSGDASFIMKDGQVINTAKFKGGFLEQSNVDLSAELSNLIVTQKAFDASSKSITTSD